jgi:hypothetical protein
MKRPTPEKNKTRALSVTLPWAYGSLFAIFNSYQKGYTLRGTPRSFAQIKTLWKSFDQAFAFEEDFSNCMVSQGSHFQNEFQFGLGTVDGRYRLCFSGQGLVERDGKVFVNPEALIGVFQDEPTTGPRADSNWDEVYGTSDQELSTYWNLQNGPASGFVSDITTYDLAENVPKDIMIPFYKGKSRRGLFGKFKNKSRFMRFISPYQIGKGPVPLEVINDNYFGKFVASPTSRTKPYLSDSDLKKIDRQDLSGAVYDFAYDTQGEYPTDIGFHIFTPRTYNVIDDISNTPLEDLDTEAIAKKLGDSKGVKYGLNPELLMTVIEVNLDLFKPYQPPKRPSINVIRSRLYLFHRKTPSGNQLDFVPFLATEVEISNLKVVTGDEKQGDHYSTVGVLHEVLASKILYTKKERVANKAKRWVIKALVDLNPHR